MDAEQHLSDVADRYRSQGYQVVVRPGSADLPDFAKDFPIEVVARRADGSALVSVKKSIRDFAADPDVGTLAGATEGRPDWRFDVVVLGPADGAEVPDGLDPGEPSEEEFRQQIGAVEQMLGMNLKHQALVQAWSVLEAAMRRRLRAEGEDAGWGTSPRTLLNELLSSGALSRGVFGDLEGLYRARSAIVHGFTTPVIEPTAVHFLLDTARKLLHESDPAEQPA